LLRLSSFGAVLPLGAVLSIDVFSFTSLVDDPDDQEEATPSV
jgi:hypothetical protein